MGIRRVLVRGNRVGNVLSLNYDDKFDHLDIEERRVAAGVDVNGEGR